MVSTPTDAAIPQSPGSGSGNATDRIPIFRDGDPQQRMINVTALGEAIGNVPPAIDSISQSVAFGDFTDGGSTSGTLVMNDAIPVGAIIMGAGVLVSAGFAGDTTATLQIGDGSDVDRYSTGTPSIFATAATGIQPGVPSGTKYVVTANTPTLTVTGTADFTSVSAGAMVVSIYFIRTIA